MAEDEAAAALAALEEAMRAEQRAAMRALGGEGSREAKEVSGGRHPRQRHGLRLRSAYERF